MDNGLNILGVQICKPRLLLQILLDGGELLGITIECKLAVLELGQIPKAAVDSLFAQINGQIGSGSPACGTRSHDVNKGCSVGVHGLFYLGQVIFRIAETRGGCIGNSVGGNNFKNPLFGGLTAVNMTAGRSVGGLHAVRGQPA